MKIPCSSYVIFIRNSVERNLPSKDNNHPEVSQERPIPCYVWAIYNEVGAASQET